MKFRKVSRSVIETPPAEKKLSARDQRRIAQESAIEKAFAQLKVEPTAALELTLEAGEVASTVRARFRTVAGKTGMDNVLMRKHGDTLYLYLK